jgi:predicted O-methyltransferase YrrM
MDWRHFSTVPQKNFDVGNLRYASSLKASEILIDPGIDHLWQEDHARIAKIFGELQYTFAVSPACRKAIYHLIMNLKPQSVLEIGTHVGGSSLYIAAALNRLGKGRKLTTVDIIDVNHQEYGPWRKIGLKKPPIEFARELGFGDIIEFYTSRSDSFLRDSKQSFDLIFLDGDHSASTVYDELSKSLRLINRNGTVLLHDYYPDGKPLFQDSGLLIGPYRALSRVRKENPAIEVLPLGQLPWATGQASDVTSLALVART